MDPSELEQQLIDAAVQVRQQAYAPYSRFLVGAAILDQCDRLYVGCNVENASYGLTICAERNAIAAAVVGGMTRIKLLAVAASGAVTPCGACRQVLSEFADDATVLLVDTQVTDDNRRLVRRLSIDELLPHRFVLKREP